MMFDDDFMNLSIEDLIDAINDGDSPDGIADEILKVIVLANYAEKTVKELCKEYDYDPGDNFIAVVSICSPHLGVPEVGSFYPGQAKGGDTVPCVYQKHIEELFLRYMNGNQLLSEPTDAEIFAVFATVISNIVDEKEAGEEVSDSLFLTAGITIAHLEHRLWGRSFSASSVVYDELMRFSNWQETIEKIDEGIRYLMPDAVGSIVRPVVTSNDFGADEYEAFVKSLDYGDDE